MKKGRQLFNIKLVIAYFIFSFLAAPTFASDQSTLIRFRSEFLQLVKNVEKYAVSIKATMNSNDRSQVGPFIEIVNSAAGLVYDDHHILVKKKVIDGSNGITVRFYDGREAEGRVVSTDFDYGLALLYVEEKIDPSMQPKMLSSTKETPAGEPVLVLTNSLDVMPAITFGIVNCTRTDGMIQLSTEMPAGTGGGAVFDFYGRLIGIIAVEIDLFPDELPYSSDLLSSETVLVYPVHEIKKVAQAMIANAAKNRVYLGIVAADWPSQLGGAHINQVLANSPAARSGFRIGDIVLSVDNHKVASAFDLFQDISNHSPGDEVKFEVLRGEQIKNLLVKITPPPPSHNIRPSNSKKVTNTRPSKQQINREFLLMRLKRMEQEMQIIKEMLQSE